MQKNTTTTEVPELEPQLASRALTPTTFSVGAAGAVLAVCAWLLMPGAQQTSTKVPLSQSDLSDQLVTIVDPSDAAAIRGAIQSLQLPITLKAEVEKAALDQRVRLAWIVFTDSIDPDGDQVAVEAAGYTQNIVLSKAWTPVAVPIVSGTIGITAVRDGGGGGITVALATRNGPVAMRIMLPGERLEVAAP